MAKATRKYFSETSMGLKQQTFSPAEFPPSMVIEITVHVLLIMISYLAITTSLLVLQGQISAVRLHTDSFFKNTV